MEFYPPTRSTMCAAVHPHVGRDGRLHAHALWLAPGRYHVGAPGGQCRDLQSPLLVYAATGQYAGEPSVDVLKSIPSYWDETVVLPVSEIRQVRPFARRKGDVWFLAITNGSTPGTCASIFRRFSAGGRRRQAARRQLPRHAIARYGGSGGPQDRASHAGAQHSLSVDLSSGGGFVARSRDSEPSLLME